MRPWFERAALRADEPPFEALWRIVTGSAVALAWGVPTGHAPAWALLLAFLLVLLSCRLVPLALRRLLPFQPSTRAVWVERRGLARRYDSYQWRKLLWFGLGMAALQGVVGRTSPPLVVLTVVCLLSGLAGHLVWRRHSMTSRVGGGGGS